EVEVSRWSADDGPAKSLPGPRAVCNRVAPIDAGDRQSCGARPGRVGWHERSVLLAFRNLGRENWTGRQEIRVLATRHLGAVDAKGTGDVHHVGARGGRAEPRIGR